MYIIFCLLHDDPLNKRTFKALPLYEKLMKFIDVLKNNWFHFKRDFHKF